MRFLVFNDPHRGFTKNTSKIHDQVFASIDQSLFDAVLVLGDWGTANTDHVRGAFKAFRKAFPNKPILGVLGNHDYWDKTNTISLIKELIKKYAKESDIHLLQDNPYEFDGGVVLGFNGWYIGEDPDFEYIEKNPSAKLRIKRFTNGMPTDKYFQIEANEAVDRLLQYPFDSKKKVVIATHFPCVTEAMDSPEWCGNPENGKKLLPVADFMFFGHTHEAVDIMVGKTRIINVGSGYKQEGEKGPVREYFHYKIVKV